jgi:cytidylate kinase
MNAHPSLDRCLAFINCQLQTPRGHAPGSNGSAHRRAVTISRQAGCGAHVIGEKLAEYLASRAPKDFGSWAVFDHNLVEKVIEDHHLPKQLVNFMPEDRISEVADIIEDLFGLHPPTWILVRKTAETILHLAELGNVILIGRGASVITSRLDFVFHIRLIGSLERRLELVQRFEHLSQKAALELIRRQDLGRSRYVKKYFSQNIDDPLLYHLVLNTDLVSCEKAAQIIGDAVMENGGQVQPQAAFPPLKKPGPNSNSRN